MRFICVLSFVIFAAPGLALAKTAAPAKSEIKPDWSTVEKRLKKEGFKKPFVAALKKSYEPKEFKNVIELNTVLFLRKTDDHGGQVNDDSVDRVRAFMEENREMLTRAQEEHGVPSSIVASLMWIESRYGENTGRFHVPSVYLHLLQADRPEVVKHLKTAGAARFTTEKLSKKTLAKIAERATKKSKWALDELRALQRIHSEKGKIALALRGSFSGAFGMPQFLPSSYSRWSKSARPNAPADLTKADDAIHSVAYYLKKNGWKPNKQQSRMQALMHYNNSKDYANAILRLAEKADGRTIASEASATTAAAATTSPIAPSPLDGATKPKP